MKGASPQKDETTCFSVIWYDKNLKFYCDDEAVVSLE